MDQSVPANLLDREFTAERPNQNWIAEPIFGQPKAGSGPYQFPEPASPYHS
jgi:hypothetical protein